MKKLTSKEFTNVKRYIREVMGYIAIPIGYYEELKRNAAKPPMFVQIDDKPSITVALNNMGYAVVPIDRYEKICKEVEIGKIFNAMISSPAKPNLGCATTRELLDEIEARIEIDGKLDYKTIDNN